MAENECAVSAHPTQTVIVLPLGLGEHGRRLGGKNVRARRKEGCEMPFSEHDTASAVLNL